MAKAKRAIPVGTVRTLMDRAKSAGGAKEVLPPSEEATIRAQRHAVYGDPQENHANIAQAWTALLRSRYGAAVPELDARMAELMLAGFKVLRAARPVPEDEKAFENYMDSYPDAKNYLNFAQEAAGRWSKRG